MDDRYRGISGRRDVIFIHPQDLADRGLHHGDRIDVEAIGSAAGGSSPRAVRDQSIQSAENLRSEPCTDPPIPR